jgi:hypothetical protein
LGQFPKLTGRLLRFQLPDTLPFADGTFDGLFTITVLQHLQLESLPRVLSDFYRLLRRPGRAFISIFEARPDLDADKRDPKGRLMTIVPPELFCSMAVSAGFAVHGCSTAPDLLGREGVILKEYLFDKL